MQLAYNFECFTRRCAKKTRGHHDEMLIYAMFSVFAVAGVEILTDKIFSAMITVASAFHCLGFILLRRKVAKQGDVSGISSRTLLAYVLCTSAASTRRFSSTAICRSIGAEIGF